MKALSLKQPYAELILQRKKTIELRKWNTTFRGEFLIHASKHPGPEAMKRFGFSSLLVSCIVGKVTLVEVKEYRTEEEHRKDQAHHLASSVWETMDLFLKIVFGLKNQFHVTEILVFGITKLNRILRKTTAL